LSIATTNFALIASMTAWCNVLGFRQGGRRSYWHGDRKPRAFSGRQFQLDWMIEQGVEALNNRKTEIVSNTTPKKGQDGSVTSQFGGCDRKIPNCLPITRGWNYTVRLLLPGREILDGRWRFPEAQPVS
jgi:hypothetical protein